MVHKAVCLVGHSNSLSRHGLLHSDGASMSAAYAAALTRMPLCDIESRAAPFIATATGRSGNASLLMWHGSAVTRATNAYLLLDRRKHEQSQASTARLSLANRCHLQCTAEASQWPHTQCIMTMMIISSHIVAWVRVSCRAAGAP